MEDISLPIVLTKLLPENGGGKSATERFAVRNVQSFRALVAANLLHFTRSQPFQIVGVDIMDLPVTNTLWCFKII